MFNHQSSIINHKSTCGVSYENIEIFIKSVKFQDLTLVFPEVSRTPSRRAITSGGVEPVADGGRDGHSVFAYYFLKKLKENERPLLDSSRLFDRIKIAVTNNSNQWPQAGVVKGTGDEGGDFVLKWWQATARAGKPLAG